MILNEYEASSKWCPAEINAQCLGSRCMAWRWQSDLRPRVHLCDDRNAKVEPPRPATVPASWKFCACDTDGASWVEPDDEAQARRKGFCGLAYNVRLP